MSPSNADALAAALVLGLPVFPCRASKRPACPNGYLDAVIVDDAVRRLWSRHPGPLIGVPTGAATGFDVLDVDVRPGGDQWLDAHSHRLPLTRTHRTARAAGICCSPADRGSVTPPARSRPASMSGRPAATPFGGPLAGCP